MGSLGDHWREGQRVLAAAGFGTARREARLLLEWVSGLTHAELLAHPERMAPDDLGMKFDDLVRRRAAGEPLAYLIGEAEFRGLRFRVSPAVLIPRPETELLVDLALDKLGSMPAPHVVDLGCGSGVVAISLALASRGAHVVTIDLSGEALALARENASRLGAVVEFAASDWFSALAGRRFDLIVANPPYIAQDDPHLACDGLPFEPEMALTAGSDGLDCIRHIVAEAASYLKPGGWLLFEHGYDQGKRSRNLLTAAGFKDVSTHPDLAGTDRVSGGHL